MIDTSVLIALGSGAISAVSAYLAYRASNNATTVDARKVDQSAYDQTIGFYEKQLDRMTSQVDRMNTQLDKVTTQLASEQDVSNTLRNQVRTLQNQVDTLNQMIGEFQSRAKFVRPDKGTDGSS